MQPAAYRHGGDRSALAAATGCSVSEILDFSASINPLGPPEWLRATISRQVEELVHYPDPESRAFVEAVAVAEGIDAETIVPGNGVSELLLAVARAVPARRVVVPSPAYGGYAQAARVAGRPVLLPPLQDADGRFELDWTELAAFLLPGDLVLLGRPNNPTGGLPDAETLLQLASARPDTYWCVDEAFIDFVNGVPTLVRAGLANLVVLRSLTKFYAIPGLRLGYAVAPLPLAEAIREQLPDWSVNTLAQAVGTRAVADTAYAEATRRLVAAARTSLVEALPTLGGLRVYPSAANFLLLRLGAGLPDAAGLAGRLLAEHGLAVRDCSNFDGLDGRWIRVAVRAEPENARLVAALAETLGRPGPPASQRRALTLMFQGTSSHAGKSWLTAALCRILLQDGVRVAPFKAQNMSNNSYVARDGGEMGRAQVLQAQACRLDPDVRMNPILLKPNSDTGSQVIVRGRPEGNMTVWRYDGYKEQAGQVARECFDELSAEFDAVILEGAGSPGEVNLKHRDIVNMAMARHAEAPVLLVGDIDRGGVYASFVGTMEVLAEWERQLLRGFVVNKFRGDASLLGPAHDYVLAHTGRPVLGVVPYLHGLNLPEEDSVGFRSPEPPVAGDGHRLDLAVVDLPHISNFNDVDPLRLEPDVALRVVQSAEQLGSPDAVLLPGTKNTLGDLAALRACGLADAIVQLASGGAAEVVGVCGGYQMLGRTLADPHHLESAAERTAGLGLLEVETVMHPEKILGRVTARHEPSGEPLVGYEIHHGRTSGVGLPPMVTAEDGHPLGAGRPDGRVWGTYLHGLFDADGFRRWWLDRLRERRGWEPLGRIQAVYDLEPSLDRLADTVREGLDMGAVYRLMGL